ncbi:MULTISPECIES: DUF1648 domain-containing protein [Sporosarcina]|uniref:DUF1648 domain-containing protein n=1 Tax=Sporosarcina TaxID=1569 RepID=UPI00058CD92E|nr:MULTISPECIES: DUF1648 domain-containing protein [Sporosarcina]WJY26240.1 DUF1648 domain-containing protein [Sporosarcina sp. 0.2-SM1T-5]
MQKNPIAVETEKTVLDRMCDAVGLVLFAGSIIYSIVMWPQLPENVPIHFNGAGEADGYGSKWILMLMPLLGIGLFALLGFLERHPEWHNYLKPVTEENAERLYTASRTLLNRIKNLTLVLFAQIQLDIVRVPLGKSAGLGIWATGTIIGLMLAVTVFGIVKQVRIK